MIKVKTLTRNPDGSVIVDLFADTKAEVAQTPTNSIVGLPAGAQIAMGSSVMTAKAEIAFMKSDGQWQWA